VHFVAVGDVMVDVVCSQLPPPDTRVHADVSIRACGSAVNAAAAAAGAGASAAVVGRTGSDQAAEFVTAELERRGIQAHLARDHELPTGVAVSLGADPATPSVVANRGANARLSAEDIPDPLEADALLVSGFALFQGGSAEAARTALDRFSGPWAGIDLSSPRLAAAARDVDFGDAGRRRTVLLATADEARAMTAKEPEEAARSLASRFAVACIKLGEQGALAAAGEGVERGAVDPVTRRSPFGAGDAFAATLLMALATETPLGRALDLACAAGARAAAAQGRA
jgi:sugar/nucleoside kinase (ribokinase family)